MSDFRTEYTCLCQSSVLMLSNHWPILHHHTSFSIYQSCQRPKKPKRDQSEKSENGDGILKEQVIYWEQSLLFFLGML